MKIIHLINQTYQVINEDDSSTLFQGTYIECHSFIELYQFKSNPFFKEFLNVLSNNQTNT